MVRHVRVSQLQNMMFSFFRMVGQLMTRSSVNSSTNDATIDDIYRRIMARKPNNDELMHWNVFMGTGTSVEQVECSLKASYEYDQLRNRKDIVLVHLPAFNLYCRSSDLDVGAQVIQTQRFEPHVASVLKEVLKPGNVFVDLGANIGYFSLMASTLVGPTGKIISFEPNTRNLELFYASVVENGMKNIVVLPVAASHTPQIHKLQSFGSNGFLVAPTPGQSGAQYIQAVVLDEILFGVPRIDAFKMDIEGFEPLALRGMLKIIDKHRPVIVTEFSPWHIEHRCGLPPQEYLEQLAACGYRISIIESSGNVTSARDPAAIMKFWNALQNEKMQLDLIARPL